MGCKSSKDATQPINKAQQQQGATNQGNNQLNTNQPIPQISNNLSNEKQIPLYFSLPEVNESQLSEVQYKRWILAKILQFDINLKKNPVLTIQRRLGRENTNDRGDALNIVSSQIMIIEFKKFLFLVQLELRKNPQLYKISYKEKMTVFKCPFPAPPLIEKAWDEIILYYDHYDQLCATAFGGFLDKPEFESEEEEFEQYGKLEVELNNYRDLLYPFWNLWPQYRSQDQYFMEKNYHIPWLSANQQKEVKESFLKEIQKRGNIEKQDYASTAQNIISTYLKKKFNFNEQDLEDEGNQIMIKNVKYNVQHQNRKPKIQDDVIQKKVEILNSMKLSKDYKQHLRKKLYITAQQCEEYIVEYKKFLLLAIVSKQMVTPSEQVDHCWHLHQQFTRQYRDDCFDIFGHIFKHCPTMGGESEGSKFNQLYLDTMDLYRNLFQADPPKSIWEPNDERFAPSMFSCSHLNLERLVYILLHQDSQPDKKLAHGSQYRVRALSKWLNGEIQQYERKYGSHRRAKYIESRRDIRRDAKMKHQEICQNCKFEQTFDPLLAYGGPLFVKNPSNLYLYQNNDFMDYVENGFYDDYDPYDNHEVKLRYRELGAWEVLESLLDHGCGDFDVEGSQFTNYNLEVLDGEMRVGYLGNGLYNYQENKGKQPLNNFTDDTFDDSHEIDEIEQRNENDRKMREVSRSIKQ